MGASVVSRVARLLRILSLEYLESVEQTNTVLNLYHILENGNQIGHRYHTSKYRNIFGSRQLVHFPTHAHLTKTFLYQTSMPINTSDAASQSPAAPLFQTTLLKSQAHVRAESVRLLPLGPDHTLMQISILPRDNTRASPAVEPPAVPGICDTDGIALVYHCEPAATDPLQTLPPAFGRASGELSPTLTLEALKGIARRPLMVADARGTVGRRLTNGEVRGDEMRSGGGTAASIHECAADTASTLPGVGYVNLARAWDRAVQLRPQASHGKGSPSPVALVVSLQWQPSMAADRWSREIMRQVYEHMLDALHKKVVECGETVQVHFVSTHIGANAQITPLTLCCPTHECDTRYPSLTLRSHVSPDAFRLAFCGVRLPAPPIPTPQLEFDLTELGAGGEGKGEGCGQNKAVPFAKALQLVHHTNPDAHVYPASSRDGRAFPRAGLICARWRLDALKRSRGGHREEKPGPHAGGDDLFIVLDKPIDRVRRLNLRVATSHGDAYPRYLALSDVPVYSGSVSSLHHHALLVSMLALLATADTMPVTKLLVRWEELRALHGDADDADTSATTPLLAALARMARACARRAWTFTETEVRKMRPSWCDAKGKRRGLIDVPALPEATRAYSCAPIRCASPRVPSAPVLKRF